MSDSGVCTEIMLFGVRVKVDPIRKCVSMNDLSQYVHVQHVQPATSNSNNNSNNLDGPVAVAADSGYASADDAIRNQSNGGRERKRGVPWTEEEHKRFLLGLQKAGKGDWRGISRKYVKTRTPTQVASHAQKYFLRRTNLNRRRRRSSLFDITTADSVADIPMEEQEVHEDNNSQPSRQPIENQMETVTFNNSDQFNGGPTRGLATKGDNYLGKKYERESLSLSLSLNLSRSCDRNNGNGLISVG